jgi:hypothetical protein
MPGRAAMNAFRASICPHHRRREDRRARAVGQQEIGDRLVADMRRSVDARFPNRRNPVDRCSRHRRLSLDELADAREVAMRRTDRVFHERWILLRKGLSARDCKRERVFAPRPSPPKTTRRGPLRRETLASALHPL